MCCSQLNNNDELKRVLSYYDLGELKRTSRVEKGFVNDNWIVSTNRGRYFLKRRHSDLRNAELIRAQHAFIRHLRRSGFPAPEIFAIRSGETLLIEGGEYYEIQQYITGKPYDRTNAAHFTAAAAALGRYHASAQDFTSEDLLSLVSWYCPINLKTNLALLAQEMKSGTDKAIAHLLSQFASHANDLSSRLSSCEELPQIIIHGDYHAGNLIFKDDEIVGVVDFDKACRQARVVELAEALIFFASPRPGHMKHLVYPGFLEWDGVCRFLRDYACALRPGENSYMHRVRALPPTAKMLNRESGEGALLGEDEVHALPDYIRAIWLCVSVRRLLENGVFTDAITPALEELSTLTDWPTANRERLVEAGYAAIRASR